MTNFTPVSAMIGGSLIGVSAVLLMLVNGRIAGVSGIVGSLLDKMPIREYVSDNAWKMAFLFGLIIAPLVYFYISARPLDISFPHRLELMIAGGFLVGFGSRLGGGCTSGHGVCGIARLSKRSVVATATFMLAAVVTVYLVNVWGIVR